MTEQASPHDLHDLMVLRSRDGSTRREPLWWRPNRAGHTSHLLNAGTYSREEAEQLERGAPEKVEPIPVDIAITEWLDRGRKLNPEITARVAVRLAEKAPIPPALLPRLRRATDPLVRAAEAHMGPGQRLHQTSESLVRMAAVNGLRGRMGRTYFAIGRLFGLGSTSAHALTLALGLDPDAELEPLEQTDCPHCVPEDDR